MCSRRRKEADSAATLKFRLSMNQSSEHPSPALRAPSPRVRRGERDGVRGVGFMGLMLQPCVGEDLLTSAATTHS